MRTAATVLIACGALALASGCGSSGGSSASVGPPATATTAPSGELHIYTGLRHGLLAVADDVAHRIASFVKGL